MKNFRLVIVCVLFFLPASLYGMEPLSSQLGVGYGEEFRENEEISQFELFYRHPLAYSKTYDSGWQLSTLLEVAGAIVDEADTDNSTGRLSLMPQLLIRPHKSIGFLVGFGTGFMTGDTEFTDQNLGGKFFLASKVGIQLLLGDHFGLEYNFYHQSNAGIYDYNASLNMNQVALILRF